LLLVNGHGSLELADATPEGTADVPQLARSEDHQRDDQNQDQVPGLDHANAHSLVLLSGSESLSATGAAATHTCNPKQSVLKPSPDRLACSTLTPPARPRRATYGRHQVYQKPPADGISRTTFRAGTRRPVPPYGMSSGAQPMNGPLTGQL